MDVIIPEAGGLNQLLSRRQAKLKEAGISTFVASPEDVIVKKLHFYREGGSEKHLRDIAGMPKISGEEIDRAYIAQWAAKMGVSEIWERVCKRVDEMPS